VPYVPSTAGQQTLWGYPVGPPLKGSADPALPGQPTSGAAIIYPLVFADLFLSSAGLYYGVDLR
jgi:hypothetical protein